MKKHAALTEFVQAALESYFMEDFADVTRPSKSIRPNTTNPQSEGAFSLEQLRQIRTLEQVLGYVNATLGKMKIGEGQGRAVYKLGGNQVLKVAKNAGGVGQNQAEATVCAGEGDTANLFPKVFEKGTGFLWLVMEEAAAMDPESFKRLTGMAWEKFQSGLKGAFENKARNVNEFDKQNFIDCSRNPFFIKIVRVIKDCKYEPGDIAKLDSWGIINGKPVILDSGFTEAVNKAYYK